MHGMRACWFCREPVTEADVGAETAQQMAVARAATAFATRPAVAEVQASAPASPVVPPPAPDAAFVTPPPPPPPPPEATVPMPAHVAPVAVERPPASIAVAASQPVRARSRVRWGRVAVLGLVGGLFLTAGALAYESVWIRYLPPAPDALALTGRTFESVGCSVASPEGWTVQTTKRRVTFLSGETAKDRSTRGFRVSATDISFSRVDDQIADLPDRLGSYASLDTFRREVDGERAVVHVFVADDLRFEQWWVDHGKRTIRVDLWSRPADEDAPALNDRIVRTITLL